jgi:hypothetical protein
MNDCTLSSDELNERLARVRSEILPHAVSSERRPDGMAWDLEDVPGLAARLDQLVALESECCSGVVFEHKEGAPGRRRLELRGLAADPPRLGGRLARAAGLGAGLSLLVCCALPIAAAAIFGAAVAAPFASLDNPWVIASVGLLFGAAALAWQTGRRGHPLE